MVTVTWGLGIVLTKQLILYTIKYPTSELNYIWCNDGSQCAHILTEKFLQQSFLGGNFSIFEVNK